MHSRAIRPMPAPQQYGAMASPVVLLPPFRVLCAAFSPVLFIRRVALCFVSGWRPSHATHDPRTYCFLPARQRGAFRCSVSYAQAQRNSTAKRCVASSPRARSRGVRRRCAPSRLRVPRRVAPPSNGGMAREAVMLFARGALCHEACRQRPRRRQRAIYDRCRTSVAFCPMPNYVSSAGGEALCEVG